MAEKVLPGGVTRGIRSLGKADTLYVQVGPDRQPTLNATEQGDTRRIPISRAVAEVLIAYGLSYGD